MLSADQPRAIDTFDRAQLSYVAAICAESNSLSDAGRILFDVSREMRAKTDDADRLRKHLARFDLGWTDIVEAARHANPRQ